MTWPSTQTITWRWRGSPWATMVARGAAADAVARPVWVQPDWASTGTAAIIPAAGTIVWRKRIRSSPRSRPAGEDIIAFRTTATARLAHRKLEARAGALEAGGIVADVEAGDGMVAGARRDGTAAAAVGEAGAKPVWLDPIFANNEKS